MPQLEHIEAIEKRLWSAADNLRANSNYASNEYFLPVRFADNSRHLLRTEGPDMKAKSAGGDTGLFDRLLNKTLGNQAVTHGHPVQ